MTADAAPVPSVAPAALLLFLIACAPAAVPQLTFEERWTEQEVSVMVQVEDLEQFLNDPVTDADAATWTKLRAADGSVRLAYEYFSLLHGMGLSWVVKFHASVAAARREMADAEAALARREGRHGHPRQHLAGCECCREPVFASAQLRRETAQAREPHDGSRVAYQTRFLELPGDARQRVAALDHEERLGRLLCQGREAVSDDGGGQPRGDE